MRLRSADERKEVIYGLEQMQSEQNMIYVIDLSPKGWTKE